MLKARPHHLWYEKRVGGGRGIVAGVKNKDIWEGKGFFPGL